MSNDDEQRILITQAKAGMRIARPVTLPNKISLCGTGTELSDSLIQRFIMRGIKRIYVQGKPLTSPQHQPTSIQVEELYHRFKRVTDDLTMLSIMRCIEEELNGI